jgi:hypothetical protein
VTAFLFSLAVFPDTRWHINIAHSIFGIKARTRIEGCESRRLRNEVTGDWRMLHNEEIHYM